MALACQQDSYKRKIQSLVLSCNEATFTYTHYGKKQKDTGYAIVLEDTVLFPEGGGQPFDTGTINENIDVVAVLRTGNTVIHYTREPVTVGDIVTVFVNWERRFDHMQQHSAQHLITAVVQSKYSFQTTSWNLGERISSIELATSHITRDELKELELHVNSLIRQCIPVNVKSVDVHSEECKNFDFNNKELPADTVGPIRIVSIDGIDNNLCCGTHVKNISDLQMVKLLNVEKGKKGKTLVNFIAGNRLLQNIEESFKREKELTKIVSGGADDHVELVQKLHNQVKDLSKINKTLLKDVALQEVTLFKHRCKLSQIPVEKLFSLHTSYGNLDFMNTIYHELQSVDPNIFVFLMADGENGKGLFLLAGSESVLTESVVSTVLQMLDGKGVMKNGKCQGKANNIKHFQRVVEFLQEIINGPDIG